MLTIHLDKLPDAPFFVPVPMVECCDMFRSGRHEEQSHRRKMHPDPEWVKAGEPCETCGDDGAVLSLLGIRKAVGPCRECIDGKPRIAITVPCEMCARGGGDHPTRSNLECPCLDGRVVVPDVWAVIEHGPLPIIHWSDQKQIANLDEFIAVGGEWWPDWAVHYQRGGDLGRRMERLDPKHPDPVSLVGTWGAICRVVTP